MENKAEAKVQKICTGKWKKTERERFNRALYKYGKNWEEVQKYVKTRTVAQVRSHAQKIIYHMSKTEKRRLQMTDIQRMSQFCKVRNENNLYIQEASQKRSESEQKQVSEESIRKSKEENLLTEEHQKLSIQHIPTSMEYQNEKFHSLNQHGYFYWFITNQMNQYEPGSNFFQNFSFLPIVPIQNPIYTEPYNFHQTLHQGNQ